MILSNRMIEAFMSALFKETQIIITLYGLITARQ